MDLSALQTAVDALEKSLDSIEGWLAASTFLVVVGLVLEYWHEVRELVEAVKRRPPFPWRKFQEIIGGVLVTVGVAGELTLQFRASIIESGIRSKSHQIEAILNNRASEANKEAGVARQQAEEAKLRAAELLALVQPREISASQRDAIRKSIKPFAVSAGSDLSPRPFIRLYTYGPLDPEGSRLALELTDVFKGYFSLELHPSGQDIQRLLPPNWRTVFGVHVTGGSKVQAFASGLRKSLQKDAGMFVSSETPIDTSWLPSEIMESSIFVVVGMKPLPEHVGR